MSIANKCDKDVELVWVQKPVGEKDKTEMDAKAEVKDVEDQFKELILKYQPELPNHKITWKIREGKVYREITGEARETRALLVVAGTHGASGLKFWIGSNANRIVSASPCPVLTIRAGVDVKRTLSKIVLPIDSTLETRQKINFTAYLAKMHDAEIHIFSIYSSRVRKYKENVDLYAKQVALHLEKEGILYHMEHAEADNISDKMIEYAVSVDANLISIMTEQETATANLWLGQYAHQTVNHSPIPVLSIHSKDILASGIGF